MIKENKGHLQQFKELFSGLLKDGLLNQTSLKYYSEKLHKMPLKVDTLIHNIFWIRF